MLTERETWLIRYAFGAKSEMFPCVDDWLSDPCDGYGTVADMLDQDAPECMVDDLAMLVRRLAHALQKRCPDQL